jgi:lipoprotein-releasing system permease protein
MNVKFIYFVALRYFKSRRQNRKIASSLLSILGISVGVMALISVLAVMNGFQLSFIEPILEIKSYHLQLSPVTRANTPDGAARNLDTGILEQIQELGSVAAVIPFYEIQTVAESTRPCFVRAIPLETTELDKGFQNNFKTGFELPDKESLEKPGSIVLGSQLARHLYINTGDPITLFSFAEQDFTTLQSLTSDLRVTGVFKTGYYEIDLEWAFISLETATRFMGIQDIATKPLTYGIKLTEQTRDAEVLKQIEGILADNSLQADFKVTSWREFNQAFFNALKTEKLMMMLLVGLIFVVVGFNIFHSLRRAVHERLDEIGTLKALGASTGSIKNIFVLEGLIIGFLGCVFGLLLGLLITDNINFIFRVTEEAINSYIIPLIEAIIFPFLGEVELPAVYIFSPNVFYIDEVPTKVFFGEALLVAVFAISCSCLAALFASHYVSKVKPSELMRYE